MPAQKQTSQPTSFIIDPVRDGASSLLKALTGSVALAGTTPEKFRLNADDIVVVADLQYAIVDISVNIPLTTGQTPTDLVNDISFGLKNASMPALGKIDVFLDQSGDSITFRTYDDFGTAQSTTLTYDDDWNGAQVIFRFGWAPDHVSLATCIVGTDTAFTVIANHTTSVPTRALNMFATVVGAENLDIDFFAVKQAEHSLILIL